MHRKRNRRHPQLTVVGLVAEAELRKASVVVDQNTGELASSVLVPNSQMEFASGLQQQALFNITSDRTKLGITVTMRLIVCRARHLDDVRLILRLFFHVNCVVMGKAEL